MSDFLLLLAAVVLGVRACGRLFRLADLWPAAHSGAQMLGRQLGPNAKARFQAGYAQIAA